MWALSFVRHDGDPLKETSKGSLISHVSCLAEEPNEL